MVASTTHENATVTTTDTLTISELTTPNTTDPVSSTSSTQFNNATTEMLTATTMQLPSTATAQVATDVASVLTTLMETSAQPDISLTLPSGKL